MRRGPHCERGDAGRLARWGGESLTRKFLSPDVKFIKLCTISTKPPLARLFRPIRFCENLFAVWSRFPRARWRARLERAVLNESAEAGLPGRTTT